MIPQTRLVIAKPCLGLEFDFKTPGVRSLCVASAPGVGAREESCDDCCFGHDHQRSILSVCDNADVNNHCSPEESSRIISAVESIGKVMRCVEFRLSTINSRCVRSHFKRSSSHSREMVQVSLGDMPIWRTVHENARTTELFTVHQGQTLKSELRFRLR